MLKYIIKIIKMIKCKLDCCCKSKCSLNENDLPSSKWEEEDLEEEEPPTYIN
tara:strand:+ start:700 stop:855 length:156 start_codon:yes stop_codon:yes gene_type:complete